MKLRYKIRNIDSREHVLSGWSEWPKDKGEVRGEGVGF